MYKILVADDEIKIRNTIKDYLSAKGLSVTTAIDGEDAVEKTEETEFDLIILDVMMPKKDGLKACEEIRKCSNVPILFLSALGEETDYLKGFSSGGDDYIVKPFSLPNLLARIEAILRRVKITEKEIASKTKAVSVHVNNDDPIVPLTQREREILECVARGCSNGEISEKLSIQEVTVKTHMNKILKKLNVSNRTQAVMVAMQMNIIQ